MRTIKMPKQTKRALQVFSKVKGNHLWNTITGKKYYGNCHITPDGKVFSLVRFVPNRSHRLTWVKPKN